MASKILLDELYPRVEAGLSNKNTVKTLERGISSYMDKNMDELTKIGPYSMILFTETDKDLVFNATGLDEKIIKAAIKRSPVKIGIHASKPINIALTLAIKYFKENKNKQMADKCVSYLMMAIYPTLFYNFWQYKPNEDIMTYTINTLSNKYKIKQSGTLYLSLWDTAKTSDRTYEKRLLRGTDDDIVYYIQALVTRIRSFLRKIANEFYKNEREKNYMSDEFDNPDPESYRESSSSAFDVDRIANAVTLKLMNSVDMKVIDLAAKTCQVSRNELRNYINTMVKSENADDIRVIISSILYLYLYGENNNTSEIRTNKFLIYCLEVYKKSNTSNPNIIKIKKILDKWLTHLGTYKKTQNLGTINNFRRSIYTFFVYSIMIKA